jgi:bifunctional N-acetylglucosamine-1-phosphate-uridyltransferase/glucosamine-1-phosphate-acetyltransferase GlmU-like protein
LNLIHYPEMHIHGANSSVQRDYIAARDFLSSSDAEFTLITMGDVPLIGRSTYRRLLEMLDRRELAVLAFESADRAQYGMLEMEGDRVARIVEWKYWSDPKVFSVERRDGLRYCNAGVYAVRRAVLLRYMQSLQERPHIVRKMRNGVESVIEEFFLTDLVEMMHDDGLSVGAAVTAEEEVIGVDTPESLARVQALYAANRKDLRK